MNEWDASVPLTYCAVGLLPVDELTVFICVICQLADIVIKLVSLLMNSDMDLLTSAHQEDRIATRSGCVFLFLLLFLLFPLTLPCLSVLSCWIASVDQHHYWLTAWPRRWFQLLSIRVQTLLLFVNSCTPDSGLCWLLGFLWYQSSSHMWLLQVVISRNALFTEVKVTFSDRVEI